MEASVDLGEVSSHIQDGEGREGEKQNDLMQNDKARHPLGGRADTEVEILRELEPNFETDNPEQIVDKMKGLLRLQGMVSRIKRIPRYYEGDIFPREKKLAETGIFLPSELFKFYEPQFAAWLDKNDIPLTLKVNGWSEIYNFYRSRYDGAIKRGDAPDKEEFEEMIKAGKKANENLLEIAKDPESTHPTIRRINDGLTEAEEVVTQELAETLKAGAYDVFIGDDTHGRLPANLIYELSKRYAHDHPDAKKPQLLYINGGRKIEARKTAIQSHLQEIFQKGETPKRALFITETIDTGDSTAAFVDMMREIGIPTDVATCRIAHNQLSSFDNNYDEKLLKYVESIKEKVGPGKIFYGQASNNAGELQKIHQGTVKKSENASKATADTDGFPIIDPSEEDKEYNRKFVADPLKRINVLLQHVLMPPVVDRLYNKYFVNN